VSTFDSEIASDVAMATPPATDGAGAQAALDTSRHRRRLGAEAIDGARLHVTVNTPAARSPVVATPVPDEAAAAEAASPGGSASTIALASSTAAIGTSKGAGTSIAGATKPAVDTTATASAVSAHDSPVPATPMTQDQGSAALAPANASPGAATAMGAGDGGGLAAAPLASGNSGQLPTAEPLPVPGRPAVVSQVPLQDVSVQITRAAKAGLDRIEIELRPDTLGRIDVRLDLGRDGRVNALILADNRETLGLLAADARGLSQVLQDAGLKADAGSLQFSLRGEHGSGGHGPGNQGSAPWAPPRTTGSEATPERGAQYGDGPAAGRPRARGRVDVIA
jgi:flagellar hook-length control protein FliK